jgi:hypothetical protein
VKYLIDWNEGVIGWLKGVGESIEKNRERGWNIRSGGKG